MVWERSGVPGGGAVRTSWFDRDLPAMWRVLENQQSDDHWRLVAGWRKAAELTATHLRRLEHYRTTLAEVWPPDRNAAAATYVARLDFLIQNVRTTHDVAAANYSTLAATVGALAAARRDLKPLHDEYVAKSRAIKDHANLVALNAAAEAPTVIGAAPASTQDLERLNNRGRAIMYTLSHTLVEAEAAIRQPPTYPSRALSGPVDPDIYGKGLDARSEGSKSNGTVGALGKDQGVDLPRQDGVGSHRSIQSVPRTEITPGESEHRSTGLPIVGSPADVGSTPRHTVGASPENDLGQRRRALPAGGIIGSTPNIKAPSSGAPVKVNPIGGVIGGPRVGSAAGGSSGLPPAIGALSGTSRDQRRRPITRQDRETVWTVPEGVEPVITPKQCGGDFDPGPVIGLDR